MGGLYSLVTTKSDGAIVNSLLDDSKKFVSSRKHDFTPLDSIEVYTVGSNVPLSDIFIAMNSHDEKVRNFDIKKASKEELYTFICSIYPDLDTDRVYPSDIKKMIKWYVILQDKEMIKDLRTDQISDEEE